MKCKKITLLIFVGLLFFLAVPAASNAQNVALGNGSQIAVNRPYTGAEANNIVPPASFAQQSYPYAEPYAGNAAYSPYAAAPYGSSVIPATAGAYDVPCASPAIYGTDAVPVAAPVAAGGPYTAGFTYSAQQASAFGPFSPPASQVSEQYYQWPGITPYGAYPGTGYSATGGVGFDPASGYYGPYGGVTPL